MKIDALVNSYTKDLFTLVLAKIIQVLLGLITLRLITEILNEEQVGIFYILLTVVSLLSFGFFNPLGQYYYRHIVQWQQSKKLKTATVMLLILRILAIPVALLTAIIIFSLLDYSKYFELSEYVTFIFIALVALTHGVFISATNVLVSRAVFSAYNISTLVVGLLLSILFVQIDKTAMGWLYGLAISKIIFSIILYKIFTKEQNFSKQNFFEFLNKSYINDVLIFIIPVTITLFFQWGQTASFRLIIGDLYSVQILAFISVGLAISSAIFSAFESLANQFYMPLYLRKITNGDSVLRLQVWNQLAGIMFPVYIGIAVFVVAFAPYLAKLLVAEKFHDAYVYAMIGVLVELFRVFTNLVYLVSQSEVETKRTIGPYIIGFLAMILGLYIVDFGDSLWMVPTILAISYFITLLLMFFNMRKLLPISVEFIASLKTIAFLLPLLVFHYLDWHTNIVFTIFTLAIAGVYLVLTQYFLLRNKIRQMSSK